MNETFTMTEEQAKEVNKFINKKSSDCNLKYAKLCLDLTETGENIYYIKTRLMAKEFSDVSEVYYDLSSVQKIIWDTTEFIYRTIYI